MSDDVRGFIERRRAYRLEAAYARAKENYFFLAGMTRDAQIVMDKARLALENSPKRRSTDQGASS